MRRRKRKKEEEGEEEPLRMMSPEPKDKEEEEDKESARVPRQRYNDRSDVGMLGIVSGSYNGCGSSHVEADLKSAPARILLLQHMSEIMLQTLRGSNSDPPDWGETCSREMRQWTYVVGNTSRYRETALAVVCAPRVEERLARVR